MISVRIQKLKDLEKAAKKLIETFSDQKIFAFYGRMGAGKTTFIQSICKYLGSADNVTSPTFALINEYTAADGHLIYHMDFFRIKNLEEVFDLGYEDYIYSGNYCFIEWPEEIESLLPERFVGVKIETGTGGERYISAQIL
jgi:tRNA threonylcarbamoyladenosine biosynthesis protein TsaE